MCTIKNSVNEKEHSKDSTKDLVPPSLVIGTAHAKPPNSSSCAARLYDNFLT